MNPTLKAMLADGRLRVGTGSTSDRLAADFAMAFKDTYQRAKPREVDHIDADGVITFAEPAAPVDVKTQTADAWLAAHGETHEQAPTIDADKSADWNRKAKACKPGSFAARRMAAEE